ncbi:MAG: hypothetical protein ACOYM9_07240 [Bradymonadia bacterium]
MDLEALLSTLLPREADALARRVLLAEALGPPVALRRRRPGPLMGPPPPTPGPVPPAKPQ